MAKTSSSKNKDSSAHLGFEAKLGTRKGPAEEVDPMVNVHASLDMHRLGKRISLGGGTESAKCSTTAFASLGL